MRLVLVSAAWEVLTQWPFWVIGENLPAWLEPLPTPGSPLVAESPTGPWSPRARGLASEECGTSDLGGRDGAEDESGPPSKDRSSAANDDSHRDVLLRVEHMSSGEMRMTSLALLVVLLAVIGSTAYLNVLKYNTRLGLSLRASHYFRATTIVSGFFLGVECLCVAVLARRVLAARRLRLRWSPRRTWLVTATAAVLGVQTLNTVSWLAEGIYQLTSRCSWFRAPASLLGFLQWTCWNSLFLLLVCMAHALCLYRPTGERRAGEPSSDSARSRLWSRAVLRLRWCCCCWGLSLDPSGDASSAGRDEELAGAQVELGTLGDKRPDPVEFGAPEHVPDLELGPSEQLVVGSAPSAEGREEVERRLEAQLEEGTPGERLMAEAEARPEQHFRPPSVTEEEGAAQALEGVAALQSRAGEEAAAEPATPRRVSLTSSQLVHASWAEGAWPPLPPGPLSLHARALSGAPSRLSPRASWRSLAAARMESRTSSTLGFARPRIGGGRPSPGGSQSDALPRPAQGSQARAPPVSAVPPPPLLIMDLGWRVHAPKIVLWMVGETFIALLVAQVIDINVDLGDEDSSAAACVQLLRYCNGSKSAAVFVSFMVALMAVYLSMYFFFLFRCWSHLSARAVSEMRTVRVLYYMQAWRVAEVFVALVVAVVVTLSIRFNSCWSYVLTWLGTVPMQVAGSGLVVLLTLTFLPQRPGGPDAMLSERLQEWSWTERHARLLKLWRDAHLPTAQRAEPLFCLETAAKLLYWSTLAYDVEEPRAKSLASLKEALDLYGLTRSELLWDRATDTKAILAWDIPAQRLLLAFAGTATLANVRTDLRMGQTVHVPRRQESMALIGNRARVARVVKVHRGFYAAYTAGGYSQKLLWRVRQILDEMEAWRSEGGGKERGDLEHEDDHLEQMDDRLEQSDGGGSPTASPPSSSSTPSSSRRHAPPLILITGHSLGGALAALAAHDVRLLLQHERVRVYTFGAPRAGNRAFVAEHGRLVPDHFALVCAQDPVPRVPKGWSYKRCGLTVLIDLKGSLLVRPSYVETSIWNRGAGYPPDHFLEQYRFAVQRFVKTQFTHLGVTAGASGVADLAEGLDLNAALLAVNCDLEALRDEGLVPLTREEAARRTGNGVAKRLVGWCGGGDEGVGDQLLVATATRKRKLFEFRTLGEPEECAPRGEPPLRPQEDGASHHVT